MESYRETPTALDRIVVVGTSGSGKTTFARALSQRLALRHVELDTLYWGPEWTPVPGEVFRERVESAISDPSWVLDGNYSAVRDAIWARATTLVWLDYGFPLVFWRAVSRTLRRIVTREELFAGNREALTLADPDWIPWWVIRTFWRRRREYPVLLSAPALSHLEVHRFRRRAEADRFLASLPPID